VGRTLLSAAFDLDFGFAFDFDFDLILPLLSSLDFAFDLPLTVIPFIATDLQQPDPSLHLSREKRKSNPADKSVRPTPDWM